MSKKATLEEPPMRHPPPARGRVPSGCRPKFALGTVTISAAAAETAAQYGIDLEDLLARHAAGDAGHTTHEQLERNLVALRTGGRVVSAYHGGRAAPISLWIIISHLAKLRTRILTERESRDDPDLRTYPEVDDDPQIVALRQRAESLKAQQREITASMPRAEHDAARKAEREAQTAFERVVLAQAEGNATADAVAAAERRLLACREHSRDLAQEVAAADDRYGVINSAIIRAGTELNDAMRGAMSAEDRRRAELRSLIVTYEQDADRVRGAYFELVRNLDVLRRHRTRLSALGATPNPRWFAGYGTALERQLTGEPSDVPCDDRVWLMPGLDDV